MCGVRVMGVYVVVGVIGGLVECVICDLHESGCVYGSHGGYLVY